MDDSPVVDVAEALLGVNSSVVDRPMLIAAPLGDRVVASSLSKLRVLQVVGRRSLPSLIEATVVPAVLFYVFFTTLGPTPAMLAVLSWTYGAVVRRLISGHGVPGCCSSRSSGSRCARSSASSAERSCTSCSRWPRPSRSRSCSSRRSCGAGR